jgi:hypothetical protein
MKSYCGNIDAVAEHFSQSREKYKPLDILITGGYDLSHYRRILTDGCATPTGHVNYKLYFMQYLYNICIG